MKLIAAGKFFECLTFMRRAPCTMMEAQIECNKHDCIGQQEGQIEQRSPCRDTAGEVLRPAGEREERYEHDQLDVKSQ